MRLLTLVPRNIGFTVAESYDSLNDKLVQASKSDNFIINFSQFYMILLRVTQIVYGELFETDATLAFNKLLQVLVYILACSLFVCIELKLVFIWCLYYPKTCRREFRCASRSAMLITLFLTSILFRVLSPKSFLQEVICPLFVWCKGHHKRGSRDVLVLEERILLLMVTYAPNLYRVFLTYGHDAVNKVYIVNVHDMVVVPAHRRLFVSVLFYFILFCDAPFIHFVHPVGA